MRAIAVLDLENLPVTHKQNTPCSIRLKEVDEWLHKEYDIVEKKAYLDVTRTNGFRTELHHLGWTIQDVVTKRMDKRTNQESRQERCWRECDRCRVQETRPPAICNACDRRYIEKK